MTRRGCRHMAVNVPTSETEFYTRRFCPYGRNSYDFVPYVVFTRDGFCSVIFYFFFFLTRFNTSRKRLCIVVCDYVGNNVFVNTECTNERRNVAGTFNSPFEELLSDENKLFNCFPNVCLTNSVTVRNSTAEYYKRREIVFDPRKCCWLRR